MRTEKISTLKFGLFSRPRLGSQPQVRGVRVLRVVLLTTGLLLTAPYVGVGILVVVPFLFSSS